MAVTTLPYRVNFKDLTRITIEGNYRQFWWFVLIDAIFGIFFMAYAPAGLFWAGLLILVLGALTPYIRSLRTISKIKQAPLNQREYTLVIDETSLQQFEGDELAAKVKLADVMKTRLHKSGIQIYVTPLNWVLAPRSAFKSEADYAEAVRLVRRQPSEG